MNCSQHTQTDVFRIQALLLKPFPCALISFLQGTSTLFQALLYYDINSKPYTEILKHLSNAV